MICPKAEIRVSMVVAAVCRRVSGACSTAISWLMMLLTSSPLPMPADEIAAMFQVLRWPQAPRAANGNCPLAAPGRSVQEALYQAPVRRLSAQQRQHRLRDLVGLRHHRRGRPAAGSGRATGWRFRPRSRRPGCASGAAERFSDVVARFSTVVSKRDCRAPKAARWLLMLASAPSTRGQRAGGGIDVRHVQAVHRLQLRRGGRGGEEVGRVRHGREAEGLVRIQRDRARHDGRSRGGRGLARHRERGACRRCWRRSRSRRRR